MSFARSSIFEAEPSARDPGNSQNFGGESTIIAGIIRIARKHVSVIACVALCVCAVTAGVALVLPQKYTASSVVIFDPRKNDDLDTSSTEQELPIDPATIQNQVYILNSRDLATRVVRRLNLNNDPEFAAGWSEAANSASGNADDHIVDSFLKHLNVQALGLSTTFSIAFTSRDPQTAAAVANALADAYLERQLETKSWHARVAAAWLTERVRHLFVDTQKAEAAVEEYKRAHGISDVMNGISETAVSTPLVDQELVALQGQLVQARATLTEKQAVRAGLGALTADGSAAALSRFTDAPVIVDLRRQEAEAMQHEADFAVRYGPKNPKLIAAEAELKDIESKIELEIERMTHAVDNDVAVAQTQVNTLQRTLHDIEQQAGEENLARATLQSLEASAKSTRTAYETFVSRLRDAQGQEAMQVPDASIISRAAVPQYPNPPSRLLIVAAAVPIGLLLGLLVALFREGSAGQPPVRVPLVKPLPRVLARLPNLKRQGVAESRIADSVVAEPTSSFAVAVRALERLIPRNESKAGFIVGVCSPTAGAGSAVLALGLSRAAAQRGRKVVLIDADPVPCLPELLDLKNDPVGLSDVVLSRSAIGASVIRDRVPGVFILTGGRSSAQLNHMYATKEMRTLLDYLRRSVDLVVVNLPPFSGMSTTVTALTATLDGLLLVVGWGDRPQPSPVEINAAIQALGAKNAGLAIVE